MYDVMQRIADGLTVKNVKFSTGEKDALQFIRCNVAGKTIKNTPILFMSANGGADVAIRAPRFAEFTGERRDRMLELVNTLHQKYRFVKFTVEDNNTVTAQMDMPQKNDALEAVAFEYFIRIATILDSVYPSFMKAIWG